VKYSFNPFPKRTAFSLLITLAVTACGGGGAGTATTPPPIQTTTPTPTSRRGTAAIGQRLAGSVFAVDVNGKVSPPTTTSALGAFVLDVGGMTAPYILSITGSAGGKQVTLNSVATAAGQTVNITPLTDLIVSTSAGRPAGSSLASLCTPVANVVAPDCLSALTTAATPANLNAAVTAVSAMVAPLNTAGTNPLTDAFTANGTGMDAVLDQILVSPAESQAAMATVTLIATNTALGQVTLPTTAGQTATTTTITPTATDLAKAAAAANVLPEIRACLASFSALYPTTGFVAPSQATVATFLDSSFAMGRLQTQSVFAAIFSDPTMEAVPGTTVQAAGLSPFDMSPLTATEVSSLSSTQTVVDIVKARTNTAIGFDASGSPVSAWVKLRVSADSGLLGWHMVKGAAYPGCPGGWKMAGSKHLDMHMHARVHRNTDSSGVTFTREWAFHIDKATVADEVPAGSPAIDTVVVKGPGLSVYSGNPAAPVGANQPLTLTVPASTSLEPAFLIGGGTTFYGNAEALQSCQDLALIPANATQQPAAGTPCIDESKVAPGKLYSWVLKSGGASGTVVRAFPFQINSVPLSKAFAQANQSDLFATITGVTPAGIAALNAAIAGFSGTTLDNLFTFNYTQSATYGSRADNCNLGLYNGGTALLRAEQNAVGSETSCTFKTAGLNSGALDKPAAAVQSGYVSVSTNVLGNNATTSQPY